MKTMKLLAFLCLLFGVSVCHSANVEVLQQSTVVTNALTFADGNQTGFGNIVNGVTFQQFPLQTYRGYQYVVFYDVDRQVAVGRRKLPAGSWEVIHFTDYNITNHDTHNVAVLGICEKDGTIHLTFDHHVSDLHYRVSVAGVANDPEAFTWSPSLFGPVTDMLGPIGAVDQVTYPRFIPMPNGNLMIYYRYVTSGNGDSIIRVYDGNTSQWLTSHGKFIDRQIGTYTFGGETSEFRYAYLNGIGYASNRLHVSWVWRDRFDKTSVTNQHDLCYAYSDDDGLTWNNSGGTNIGVTGSSFINLDSPGLVVAPIDPWTNNLKNQTTQYVYPDGGVHVMLQHYIAGTSTTRYHHHWRDPAGNWHFEVTPRTGSRPELVGDDQRNLFLVYKGAGEFRVLKGVPNAGFTAWNWSSPALIYQQSNPEPGGDGQIDLSRWHSERVLSIYTQEEPSTTLDYGSGTPFDGLPTPLHVNDFQVVLRAAQPDPSHQALHVSTSASLGWTAGLNSISNRVYFGTDSNAIATATTASPEYKGQQSGTSYVPAGSLAAGTTYYWRIDAVQSGPVVYPGLAWEFTTATVFTDSFTWDAGNTNNGGAIDPASGTWNKTAGNKVWNNGLANTAWGDGTNANFAGADGAYTITLGENVTASSVRFNSSGYTLTGSGVTLFNTGNLTVASNKSATIGSGADTLLLQRNSGDLLIGQTVSNAAGILNIASGATVKGNSHVHNEGVGTVINVSGTLESSSRMRLGSGNTNANYVSDVTVNILSGGVVRSVNDVWEVGYMGSAVQTNAPNVQGTVVVQNGGTLQSGSPVDKEIRLGQFGTGTLTVQPGGTVNGSNLILGNGGAGAGILNLDGGEVNILSLNIKKPDAVLNFNGGTLKATTNNTSQFLRYANSATINVRDGGAVIDSAGFDVGTETDFVFAHSSIGGDNAVDGGLTKKGLGAVTLRAANTYTGPTTVNVGTLVIQQPTLSTNSTVTVASGAVLQLDFAGGATNTVDALVLGGVNQPDGVYDNGTDPTFLAGAGSLQVGSGAASTPGNPQNVQLVGDNITFDITNSSGIYRVQGATNMATPVWVDIATNAAPFGFTNNANLPQQYYRTVTP